jgi:uncharacterized membrane protein YraQ (UPF0718 family)
MKKQKQEKINGTQLFLGVVITSYLFLLFIDYSIVTDSLMQFLRILREIIPVFIVVFIFMFFFNLFFDERKTAKTLGESSGIKGWITSIIGGVLAMGPVYMWYPLLSDLQKKGMRNSFIAVFLYNRSIKLPLLPVMAHYFGLAFTIIITLYMILFSIINGLLINKFLTYENRYCGEQQKPKSTNK